MGYFEIVLKLKPLKLFAGVHLGLTRKLSSFSSRLFRGYQYLHTSNRMPDSRSRSRSRSPRRNRDSGRSKNGGGFRWKEKRRDEERENDRRLERGYRDRDQRRDRDREQEREREKPASTNSGYRDREVERPTRTSDETVGAEKHKKVKKEKKAVVPVAPAEAMIIVNVNDRLGTKAAIPCLASDPISESLWFRPYVYLMDLF